MKKYLLLYSLLNGFLLSPLAAQDQTLEMTRRQAEQGMAGAQTELGYLYHTGEGVDRDYDEAVKWYRLAARQGHPDAQYNLGVAYAFGQGVTRDATVAIDWYRQAAAQGHKEAAFSLGLSYLHGNGVARDSHEAAHWFQQAAEQGYSRAQVHLAGLYLAGNGVPQNDQDAAYWYRQAAQQGDKVAQYQLGKLYHAGRGVPRDQEQALSWWRMAADQDYAPAATELETRRLVATAPRPTPADDRRGRIVSPPLAASGATASDAETGDTGDIAIVDEPEASGFADMTATDGASAALAAPGTHTKATTANDDNGQIGSGRESTAAVQPRGAGDGITGMLARLFGDRQANKAAAQPAPGQQQSPAAQAAAVPDMSTKNAAGGNGEEAPVQRDGEADGSSVPTTGKPAQKVAVMLEEPPAIEQDVTISAAAQRALAAEDHAEALRLLQEQALNKNAAAETRLGDMYSRGLGVEQSQDRALLWYRRAARRNYADAQYKLGTMYLHGVAVLQDHEKAHEWLAKAAEQGHQAAAEDLAAVERRLAERQRYQPEPSAATTQQQLETAVEQHAPPAPTSMADTTPSSRRIISPPLAPPAQTNTSNSSSSEPTPPEQQHRPESGRRIISPPIETVAD